MENKIRVANINILELIVDEAGQISYVSEEMLMQFNIT